MSSFEIIRLNTQIQWLIFITGLFCISIITGVYPAIHLSSFKPALVLFGRQRTRWARKSIREFLIVFQFIITIFLIFTSIIISKQIYFINNTGIEYEKDNLMYIKLTSESYANMDILKDKLNQNPDISQISFSLSDPLEKSGFMELLGTYKEKKIVRRYNFEQTDGNYINMMGLNIIKGRQFIEDFKEDTNSIIINEAAAKEFQLDIGSFLYPPKYLKIVGIVENFHFQSLHYQISPFVFYNRLNWNYGFVNIKISSNISEVLNYIRNTWLELSPDFPLEYSFVEDSMSNLYKKESNFREMVLYLTLLAIFISCLGLFGLISFTAERRTKEIGIRKVNGANISNIIKLLNRDFIKWIFLGFIVASPIAYFAMKKWLENFAYKTELSWWVFCLAGLMALMIALITVSLKSYKAATKNPVEALRYE